MKQKTKSAMLAVLMLAAAGVFYYDSRGVSFPGKTVPFALRPYAPLPVENPALQRWKLEASRRTEYKSGGRDLFRESPPPAPGPHGPAPARDPPPQHGTTPPPPHLPAHNDLLCYCPPPHSPPNRPLP